MRVSIIIPCHNYAQFLPEAVASLLAQTMPHWEAIIVDDGSTDDSLAVAQDLLRCDARLRLLHQPNQGVAAARNAGASRARAEMLVFLDADDLLAPTYLARCLAALDTDPRAGFAYTGLQLFGADWHTWPSLAFDRARLAVLDFVPPPAMVRRTAYEAAGGFCPAVYPGYADWDFWLGVVAAGWPGRHVPAPLLFYRRHAASMSADYRPDREWDARAQLVCRHPTLYSARVRAWATIRCARRGLPLHSTLRPGTTQELVAAGPPLPAPAFHLPTGGNNPPRARRLIRMVPFALRARVQYMLRRLAFAARGLGIEAVSGASGTAQPSR